jgi:uncharacterized SAM-binding protein YcdF (DUF218 family)
VLVSVSEVVMSFAVIKTFQFLVLPPASILALMLLGFMIVRIHRSCGRVLIAAGFLSLYGLSVSPVSNYLIERLEADYRPLDTRSVKADVIVVLGGGARDLSWAGLKPEPGEGSLQRLVAGIKLYRSLHLPLFVTGGAGDPAHPELSDSAVMAGAALELGIPRKDLRLDTASPNTLASACAVKKLYTGKRVILVTAAYHLKRSIALFKSQDLDVIPQPSGYLRGDQDRGWYAAIPRMSYLGISATALSEHLAYARYKIKRQV